MPASPARPAPELAVFQLLRLSLRRVLDALHRRLLAAPLVTHIVSFFYGRNCIDRDSMIDKETAVMGTEKETETGSKTVVVLGCAYGGARAAQILAAGLPPDWRLVVLERNSHANHVYVMPRFAVVPGHEYKAFVPYTNVFLQNRGVNEGGAKKEGGGDGIEKTHDHAQVHGAHCTVLHAQITALGARSVSYRLLSPSPEQEEEEHTLAFDFAVYALGAHLPAPLDLWGAAASARTRKETGNGNGEGEGYRGRKDEGCAYLVRRQAEVASAVGGGAGKGKMGGSEGVGDGDGEGTGTGSVLVVGGGALGIQFATDIKAVYPGAAVTLLHSRARLLPRFGEGMHEEVLRSCDALGVQVILGERLDLGSLETKATAKEAGEGGGNEEVKPRRVVRTVSGREIEADLVLMCTGQTPNTALLSGLDETLVESRTKHVRVHRTMQVAGRTVYDPEAGLDGAKKALDGLALTGTPAGDKGTDSAAGTSEATDISKTTENHECASSPYPHIFAIGDAAAAFGAIPAGHNAYAQGEVAARNVLRLIRRGEARAQARARVAADGDEQKVEDEHEPLEEYTPGPPAIKVSLGLERAVYQVGPNIGVKTDGVPDLQAAAIWPYFGIKVERDEDMRV